MKLNFFANYEDNVIKSYCNISNTDQVTINCLMGLLRDCDYLSNEENITALEDGVAIFSLDNLSIQNKFWDRDAWGYCYIDNKVKVYSLYDDEYFIKIELEIFSNILRKWLFFNQDINKQKLDGACPHLASYQMEIQAI